MKLITLNDEYKKSLAAQLREKILAELSTDKLLKDAADCLSKLRMADGQFSFQKSFKFEKKFLDIKSDKRAKIKIMPDAFSKIMLILTSQNKEVGWHGVTERVSETEFILKNVLVYPQKVTAVTVDTDEEEYAKWLIDIGEDNFNNLHYHGHSHVNMVVTPSKTDMDHRQSITSQLGPDDYYIFMIWNKSLDFSAAVYDMASNILFETDDIDVILPFSDGTSAGMLIKELDDKVKPYVAPASKYPTYGGNSYPSYGSGSYGYYGTYDSKKNEKTGKAGGSAAGNGRDGFRDDYYYV